MLKSPKRQPSNELFPATELRGLRAIHGLRVEDVADRADVNKNTVNEVLLGGDTRVSTLREIAAALGARVKIEFERVTP
jgi:transcriptional regulator with XRE-family HTH domain